MVTIATDAKDQADDQEVSDFIPLTASQAMALREQHPSISPWWVVVGQLLVGVLVTCVAWAFTGSQATGWSAASGALAVIVPAALFARGVTGQFASVNAGSAVLSFFVWEMVKIFMTVGMLFAAHRLVVGLSWPAMLIGMVLTMKVYWLALGFKRKPAQAGAN
jgi:ATP synthase protein I